MTLFSGVIAFNTSLSGLKAAHSLHKDNLIHWKICHSGVARVCIFRQSKVITCLGARGGGGGGSGGGLLNNVLYGRLRPEVQSFNILYTIFDIFDTFY